MQQLQAHNPSVSPWENLCPHVAVQHKKPCLYGTEGQNNQASHRVAQPLMLCQLLGPFQTYLETYLESSASHFMCHTLIRSLHSTRLIDLDYGWWSARCSLETPVGPAHRHRSVRVGAELTDRSPTSSGSRLCLGNYIVPLGNWLDHELDVGIRVRGSLFTDLDCTVMILHYQSLKA